MRRNTRCWLDDDNLILDNNRAKVGTSYNKIIKGGNSTAVEVTTTVSRKPAKDATEKKNTFPTITKDKTKHIYIINKERGDNIARKEKFPIGTKDHLKKSSVLKTPKEPSSVTPNYEKNKGLIQMQERNDAKLPSISLDKTTIGEKISSHKIIKKVNSSDAKKTTTIPRKSAETFTEKDRTFPTFTKENAISGFKSGTEKEAGKKITKELKPKKDTKEYQKKSSFVVSKEQPSPVAGNFVKNSVEEGNKSHKIIIKEHQNKSNFVVSHEQPSPVTANFDNNTAGEGISSDKITKEADLTSVEGTTTVQRKPTEGFTEKEGTFPTGTKEKVKSKFKNRVGKEDGHDINKKHKHKKDTQIKSNERPKGSCLVVSHEEHDSVPTNIEKDELLVEMQGICDKMSNVSFSKDNCTSDTNVNKVVNLAVDKEDTSYCVIIKEGIAAVEEAISSCKIKKEKNSTPVEEETSFSIQDQRNMIEKERNLPDASNELPEESSFVVSREEPYIFIPYPKIKREVEREKTNDTSDLPFGPDNCTSDTNVNKKINLSVSEEDTSYCMIIKEGKAAVEEAISSCNIKKENNSTPVEEETSSSIQNPKNTIEKERNLPNASNELPKDSSFVVSREEPYIFIPFPKVKREVETEKNLDTSDHPFGPDNCTSGGETSSCQINNELNSVAVEETTSVSTNAMEKENNLSCASHELLKECSFGMPHLEQYTIIPNSEMNLEVDMEETNDTSLHSSTDNCTPDSKVKKEVNLTVDEDLSFCMIIKEVKAVVEEAISSCNIKKEKNSTPVEKETSSSIQDPKNTIEKERNLPNASNELPKDSSFVVSCEEPYIFIPYPKVKREVEMEKTNDTSRLLLDNCTSGGETSFCHISEERNSVAVEETTSVSKQAAMNMIEKEYIPCASHELLKECSLGMPHLKQFTIVPNLEIKQEANTEETNDTSFRSCTDNFPPGEETSSCHIIKEVYMSAAEETTSTSKQVANNRFGKEATFLPASSERSNGLLKECSFGIPHLEPKTFIPNIKIKQELEREEINGTNRDSSAAGDCASVEATASCKIKKEVDLAAVEGTTLIPVPSPKNTIEEGNISCASNELPPEFSFVMTHGEPYNFIANYEDVGIEEEKQGTADTTLHSFAQGNCTFREETSDKINKGVVVQQNIPAVEETLIPMPAPKNMINKLKNLPSDSNEHQEKTSFVMAHAELSSVTDNFENGGKGNPAEKEERSQEQTKKYYPGSIIWAKYDKYPWWPSIVDMDPDSGAYHKMAENNTKMYHVSFLDAQPTHAWVSETLIRPFSPLPAELKKIKEFDFLTANAMARAQEAEKLLNVVEVQNIRRMYCIPKKSEACYKRRKENVRLAQKELRVTNKTSLLLGS
ncbi:hypothetical protein TNCT_121731 [Trichonephila clavata]|uniref:PWWP domain-containing protein n=1 Tax=Trichonephila clavata TaxID=2740835 RepID=A0A8X6KA23_TRICU|nr:hypothetical protein TNCT_121731 [Trichonephila clavata]